MCRGGPLADPRQALLGLSRSLAAPCSCHSGFCRAHGWHLPAGIRSELRLGMALETDLFARPGEVDPEFLQWHSLDPEGPLMGSAGSPWDCAWDGMFALCAPRLTPQAGPDALDRILVKAHQAACSPRPTRIVVVVDRSLPLVGVPLGCRLIGGARVVVIENTAATAMFAGKQVRTTWQARPMRWTGEPRLQPGMYPLIPSWHPQATVSSPEWLSGACREVTTAFRAFSEHDRYAGALGVPARNLALVLACRMEGCDRPSAMARSAADRAVPVAMLALLLGAHKAWLHSCECRRAWWRHMDDRVMDSEIEFRQLRLHLQRQSQLKRKYRCQMSRRAAKRRRIAHLSAIASHKGMTRLALEASRPGSRDSIPPDLAALVPPLRRRHGEGPYGPTPRVAAFPFVMTSSATT
jgi:hypothetical protein